MQQFVYDGSFAGLCTAVFEVFERRCTDAIITRSEQVQGLVFEGNKTVHTDLHKARRVWKGLQTKLSPQAMKQIYWCYLSGIEGIDSTILEFIRYVYASRVSIEEDYSHAAVLTLAQVTRKVGREKHRFEAFVRFERIGADFYYAPVEPDYNILPLIVPHFKSRYAGQHWLIYDTKRRYGMHYDKDTEQVQEAVLDAAVNESSESAEGIYFDAEEQLYQDLWKDYFKSVNIASRKNTRLHLRHVPRRYWKYLVEKQPDQQIKKI